jgi:hypothetical protein
VRDLLSHSAQPPNQTHELPEETNEFLAAPCA